MIATDTPFAPATQVLITVQFDRPIPPLNALQIAKWYEEFRESFPRFGQIPQAGPMPYHVGHLDGSEALEYSPSEMPRLHLISEDGSYLIYFQADRFSFGWNKTSPQKLTASYNGFENILPVFLQNFMKLRVWLLANGMEVEPKVAELAYVNLFRTVNDDGTPRDLSSIYSFLKSVPSSIPMNSYNYWWNEDLIAIDGIVVVSAQGPIVYTEGIPHTMLSLTGTFAPRPPSQEELEAEFLEVRAQMRNIFNRITSPERVATY